MVDSFDNLMRQCMFCLPGRITAFNPETQLAQIECGIQRLRDGKGHTIPVIENVPVCFPGDGEFYFWHQITPGETEGLIHFAQRAIDTWIDQGGPVAPHEARMLTEDDAFFVPGVRSRPGAIPGFKNDGAGISNYAGDTFAHLKSSGEVQVESPATVNVTAAENVNVTAGADANVDCENATITAATKASIDAPDTEITGNLLVMGTITGQTGLSITGSLPSGSASMEVTGTLDLVSGDVVVDGQSLKQHVHPGDSGGTTGTWQ